VYEHLCLDLCLGRDHGFVVAIDPWIVRASLQID
jgi:hypothetical protein